MSNRKAFVVFSHPISIEWHKSFLLLWGEACARALLRLERGQRLPTPQVGVNEYVSSRVSCSLQIVRVEAGRREESGHAENGVASITRLIKILIKGPAQPYSSHPPI